MILFFVYYPGNAIENVIVIASGRERAKRKAQIILKGNPDNYVVDPITSKVDRTVFMLDPESS